MITPSGQPTQGWPDAFSTFLLHQRYEIKEVILTDDLFDFVNR